MKNKIMLPLTLFILLLGGCANTQNTPTEEIKTNKSQVNRIENPNDYFNQSINRFDKNKVDGNSYQLTDINQTNTMADLGTVTFSFSNDTKIGNVINGNAGCNKFYIQYNRYRNQIMTEEAATTNKKCEAEQMNLENFIFKVLSNSPEIALNNDYLYLRTSSNLLTFKIKK